MKIKGGYVTNITLFYHACKSNKRDITSSQNKGKTNNE